MLGEKFSILACAKKNKMKIKLILKKNKNIGMHFLSGLCMCAAYVLLYFSYQSDRVRMKMLHLFKLLLIQHHRTYDAECA